MSSKLKLEPSVSVPVVETVSAEVRRGFSDRNPSNWDIVQSGSGVSCRNSVSGEVFEGSVADFNALLRG